MRFTIGRKVWLGFGIIILLNLVSFFITNTNVKKSSEINTTLTDVYNPSLENLENFKLKIEQSRILINYWSGIQSIETSREKRDFLRVINTDLPQIKLNLDTLSNNWPSKQKEAFLLAFIKVDELKQYYQEIQELLPDFKSYNVAFNRFVARDLTDQAGPIEDKVNEINTLVNNIITEQRAKSDNLLLGMSASFDQMRFIVTVIGGFLILLGIIIAIITVRAIVKPTQVLRDKLMLLSEGVVPNEETKISNDEIGDMSTALNQLIHGQRKVQTFVNALGRGDFKVKYEPLGINDQMAPSFIRTRDELAENERITEQKIIERTEQLAEKNRIVTELYQDLKDSINYAKRLQDSILPTEEVISKVMGESFIYFRPKETVSGDYYWVKELNGMKTFAAIDCTGHGVPGAFMSLIGYNSLNRAFGKVNSNDPGEVMDEMNRYATSALNRNKGEYTVRDGMDMALCIYDPKSKEMHFSGAGRPLIYLRDGEVHKVRGDRDAIGSFSEDGSRFTSHTVQMQTGDVVYVFSDGYPDQFGGDEDPDKLKKFKLGRFYKMLQDIADKKMYEQEATLDKALLDWQGPHPQIDDIIVMGFRVE